MTTKLLVAHGNGRNKHSLVDWLASTDWDSAGCAEAERLVGPLRGLGKVVVTDLDFDRAKDTPIVVADEHRLLSSSTSKVSRALGRRGSALNKVAPARVLTEARYEHPVATALGCKGVAHINVHPVAGPKQLNGRNPLAPLTRQYRRAWAAARKAWRQAQRDGYLLVLTSDAQMTATSRRAWSPAKQAHRLKALTWSTRIDWIFYDPRLVMVGVPRTHQLYDHTGFVATFIARPSRSTR